MASRNLYRTASKFTNQSTNYAGRMTEKAAVNLARWATTDHTGSVKFFATMPRMGFVDTLIMALAHIVMSIVGAVVSAVLFFLLIAYGIPLLLSL
jgi:hypothetical protein